MHSVKPASRDQTRSEAEYSKGMTIKYRVQSTKEHRVQSAREYGKGTEYRVQSTREYRVQASMARVQTNQSVSLYLVRLIKMCASKLKPYK